MSEVDQQPTSVATEEQDKRDAARYRWLRDHPQSSWQVRYLKPFEFVCRVPFADLDNIPATLDMAIDQALGVAAPVLLDTLKELLASQLALMPPFEAGKEAQDAWADRRANARNDAAAAIAKAEGKL